MAAFIDEDMNILHVNTFVFNASIDNVECSAVIPNFLCKNWKTFVMYWWFVYFMFWNSVLGVAVCACFLMLVWLPCRSSTFSGSTGSLKSCGGFSLSLDGLCDARLTGLAFARIIGFGFVMGEPSLEVASWPLIDMALCVPIGSERKLLKWLQENIEKLIKIEQTRKTVPFVTRKTPHSQHVSKLVLMSTYLIWIFGSKLIEQPNKRNSVGSGNTSHCRASSLEKTSWWQLHLSSKMYNWDSSYKECVLVCTKSTSNNCSNSRFLVSVDVLVLFLVDGMDSCPALVSLG